MPGDRIPNDPEKVAKIVKALMMRDEHDLAVADTLADINNIPSRPIHESEIDRKEKEGEENVIKLLVNGIVGYQLYVKRHEHPKEGSGYEDFFEIPKDDIELKNFIREVRSNPKVKVLVMNAPVKECGPIIELGIGLEEQNQLPYKTTKNSYARRIKSEINRLAKTVTPGTSEANQELENLRKELEELQKFEYVPIPFKDIQEIIEDVSRKVIYSQEDSIEEES